MAVQMEAREALRRLTNWTAGATARLAILELEWALGRLTKDLVGAATAALGSLDTEQAGLLEELNAVIQWLDRAQVEEPSEEFPPPLARLVPGEDRAVGWEHAAEAAARERLPLSIETIVPRHSLPPRRSPWRALEPQKAFLAALARSGRRPVLDGFREAEADHRTIVREIERAHEVATFSLEAAREGIANALSLASYQKQTATGPHTLVERQLAEGIASIMLLTHVTLDQGRLGLLNLLARESGSRFARDAVRLSLDRIAETGKWAWGFADGVFHRLLQKIGWEAPPKAALAPVEEPRFLVGRDAEMAAPADARGLWQADRPVSEASMPGPVAMQILPQASTSSFLQEFTFRRVGVAVLILFLAWLAIRWLSDLLEGQSRRSTRAPFVIKWTEPVVRIGVWFAAILICFNLLAPSRETFLAGIASLGIALGLGAQDLVKNLIGGLVVLGDRPYQLGGRVRIGDAYGEIDHIGLRSTKLTTPEDTRATIPDEQILSGRVFSANSGVPDCQVVTDLFLPPDTGPETARKIGFEAAICSPFPLARKPVVILTTYGFDRRPYLHVRIKCYVYGHRFEPHIQSDVTARASHELLRQGLLQRWGYRTDVE